MNISSALRRLPLAFALSILLPAAALVAAPITGTVTNGTNGKLASGDDVVLIRLSQGMQESTRTKTDAKGHFSLDVPDPDGIHLVRVTHDKANYFAPVQPGTTRVDVEVFTAAAKVDGVVEEADVMKIETDPGGATLKVIENFFLKNDSKPPKTQFSDRPFQFVLPAGSIIDGTAAKAPGGMQVRAEPVPLEDPGHYAFIFPIRPVPGGNSETRFQITYHVPYKGSLSIAPKLFSKVQHLAVELPKSMAFKADNGAGYQMMPDSDVSMSIYVFNDVDPAQSQATGFTVSGQGQFPREADAAAPGAAGAAASAPGAAPGAEGAAASVDPNAPASADTRPGGGLGTPVDPTASNDPWSKYRGWIIAGFVFAFAIGAGIYWKGTPGASSPTPATGPVPTPRAPQARVDAPVAAPAKVDPLQTLKEELFALETERLQGKVTEEEYLAHKSALETVLRRALDRAPGGKS